MSLGPRDISVVIDESSLSLSSNEEVVAVNIDTSSLSQAVAAESGGHISVEEIRVNVEVSSSGMSGIIDPNQFFQTGLRFSELDTPQKRIEAQQNLGVAIIDCGEFTTAIP